MRLPDDLARERAIADRLGIERIKREAQRREAELAKGNRHERRRERALERRRK